MPTTSLNSRYSWSSSSLSYCYPLTRIARREVLRPLAIVPTHCVSDSSRSGYVDEAHPVGGRGAVQIQSLLMQRGAVTLVLGERILRILLVELTHDPVPGHLGQNRRGRNTGGNPVTLPNRQPRHAKAVDTETIRQYVRRRHVEP